jgi:hypothetical protein
MTSVAPLLTLRRLFALLVLFSTTRFVLNGWVETQVLDPFWTFPFDGFEWLPRPSLTGAWVLFLGMIFGGLLLLAGRTAKVGAAMFFVCFTYVELLDKSNYLNHYYFVSLVAFMLVWLPTTAKTPSVPRLATTSIRLLLALVYFYAGLAKLNADWLLHAQPLAMWLPQHSSFPVLGPLFASKSVAFAFSWAGAAFDLFAPFALFSDRIRPYFYPVLVTFHVLTWILFPIGVFPWVMIACTTVFFTDKWHARLWSGMPGSSWQVPEIEDSSDAATTWSKPQVAMVWLFLGIQMLFPWRTLAYEGSMYWHESGYRFGWRVMLMEKAGWATYFIQNDLGEEREFQVGDFLTPNQEKMMSTQPDLMIATAKKIQEIWNDAKGEHVRVRAEVWASLNGRRSQLMIEPFLDLTTLENDWSQRTFVLPLDSVIRPRQYEAIKDSLRHARGW